MIYYKAKDFKNIISATFPDYRRQKVIVEPVTFVTLHDLNWSGGSRSQYRACSLDGRRIANKVDMNSPAPWDNVYENMRIDLPPDTLIVRGGHFCGKVSTLVIYCHPDNMPKLLPEGR